MKRDLILIRHTKSDKSNFSGPDFERPIRKDREDDAKQIGEKLRQLELKPELIICSPALRTKQTAGLLCRQIEYDFEMVKYDIRLYESWADEYLKVVNETPADIKTLVLVGHNPSVTHFANLFLNDKIDDMPTTGVVWLQFVKNNWELSSLDRATLKAYLTPKTI